MHDTMTLSRIAASVWQRYYNRSPLVSVDDATQEAALAQLQHPGDDRAAYRAIRRSMQSDLRRSARCQTFDSTTHDILDSDPPEFDTADQIQTALMRLPPALQETATYYICWQWEPIRVACHRGCSLSHAYAMLAELRQSLADSLA